MTIGQRITALRKAAGLSQEALAGQLNVSRQAIGKWEAETSLPGIDNLQELSRVLGVSCDELLTGQRPAATESEAAPKGQGLSLDGVKALLDESRRAEKKRHILSYAAAGLVFAIILAGILFYAAQVGRLQRQVDELTGRMSTLNSQIDGQIAAIQNNIQQSLEQQTSIVADWSIDYGAFDPMTDTARVTISATPKAMTEATTAQFSILPVSGEAQTLDARLENGVFTANFSLPVVDAFTVNAAFTADGVTQTEKLCEEYNFAQRYHYQLQSPSLHNLSASHISGSPDLVLRREATELELEVTIPFLNGQPLEWPAEGTLTLSLDGKEVEAIPVPVIAQKDLLPQSYDSGFSQTTYSVTLSLEEKTFTLPWKEEYENGDWPESGYSMTLISSAPGRDVLVILMS